MKIIIVGAYAIGTHLAKLLSRSNNDITLIDEDEERLTKIGNDYDILTMQGNPSSIHVLRDVKTDSADLLIEVSPHQS